MVEIRRGMGEVLGSDRLPWLEPVEDEDQGRYPDPGGFGGVIVTVIAVLIGHHHDHRCGRLSFITAPPAPDISAA